MAVGKKVGCQGCRSRPQEARAGTLHGKIGHSSPSTTAWWPVRWIPVAASCVAKYSGLFLMKNPGIQGEQDKRGDDLH